ncbi:ABC transporter permease [Halorarum halobium]|uniref:ABC transporter permease n=1 Tax=Halorarum halobium TaxID=3075121 RepID=UPI0028A7F645|nr:ABC transporter permease subunit [Halobaculum sp. XH14]
MTTNARSTRSTVTERLRDSRLYQPSLIAIALFLGGWQLVSQSFDPSVFPGLALLADNIWMVLTEETQFGFIENLRPSVIRIAVGFSLSMIIGVVLGTSMGIYPVFEEYVTAPVMAVMTFPAVVWAFLGVLWFGITDYVVSIFVITLAVAPYVAVNIWKGAEAVDHEIVEMAETFEASRISKWRHIHIPHLQPFTFSSARLAFALSWKISLIAEVFGATSGVGYVVDYYFQTLRADMVIAWALPVMIGMFLVERMFKRLEERSFEWRPELEESAGQRR